MRETTQAMIRLVLVLIHVRGVCPFIDAEPVRGMNQINQSINRRKTPSTPF